MLLTFFVVLVFFGLYFVGKIHDRYDEENYSNYTKPFLSLDHNTSCAMVGVKYYNKKKISSLYNTILSVDWCGKIFYSKFEIDETGLLINTETNQILQEVGSITDIFINDQNDILLLDYSGNIYKIIDEFLIHTFDLNNEVTIGSDEVLVDAGNIYPALKDKDVSVNLVFKTSDKIKIKSSLKKKIDNCKIVIKYSVAGQNNFIKIDNEIFQGGQDIPYGDTIFLNFNRGSFEKKLNKNNLNSPIYFNVTYKLEERYNLSDSSIKKALITCSPN